MNATRLAGPRRPGWLAVWQGASFRATAYQTIAVILVIAVLAFLVANVTDNLATRNIASGFGFLDREASFAIGESIIPYQPSDNYARAFLVGLLNTLKVAALGIVLATIIGTVVGIARLSHNWLIARLALIYVETLRNIPLLLQLFFWYALITELMPGPRQALNPLTGVFVSNRGIEVPVPAAHPVHTWMLFGFAIGLALAWLWRRWAHARQARKGVASPVLLPALAVILGLPLLAWLAGGAPTNLDIPALKGFNFRGGFTLSPEFTALLLGLTLYTASFIAEIVRSGIEAVGRGQTEAAYALGLDRTQTLRLVILPQAMRVIIPPMTSQYLNLTKNSSLAVAIGYPDLVSIATTSINQTGQAIEGIALIMAVYLFISLAIALGMNIYNRAVALVER